MKTLRKILSIPFVLIAGACVSIGSAIGGYHIELDISNINSD